MFLRYWTLSVLGHDLDFSWSRDIIGHVTIQLDKSHFPLVVLWTLNAISNGFRDMQWRMWCSDLKRPQSHSYWCLPDSPKLWFRVRVSVSANRDWTFILVPIDFSYTTFYRLLVIGGFRVPGLGRLTPSPRSPSEHCLPAGSGAEPQPKSNGCILALKSDS